jgi:hypothetical protein
MMKIMHDVVHHRLTFMQKRKKSNFLLRARRCEHIKWWTGRDLPKILGNKDLLLNWCGGWDPHPDLLARAKVPDSEKLSYYFMVFLYARARRYVRVSALMKIKRFLHVTCARVNALGFYYNKPWFFL